MTLKSIPALLLLGATLSAGAQTKEKPKDTKEKKESITIRKKADSKDKITIVIDGDKITINGKPLEDMKDSDIEVLRNKGIDPMLPRIRARIKPMMGSMRMLKELPGMRANRAILGVASEKDEKGAKITSVTKESAAEKAGLQKDDIITKVGDNHTIQGSDDLYEAIGNYQPGEKVAVTYIRDGKTATTTATLDKSTSLPRKFNFNGGDFNRDFNFDFATPDMPQLRNLDLQFRKPRLGLEIQDLEEGKGVKVLDVDGDTPAAKAGLQKDDVITEIDGKTIASVDELRTRIRELKEGDSIKITYQRAGKTQTADIKFPKKLKTAEL